MKRYTIALLSLLMLVMLAFREDDFEVSKNIEIFADVFKQLKLNYVDEVQSGELMKTGIDAMLESLDPYTVYFPESQIEDVRFLTTGQYGGIGAVVFQRDGKHIISEPYIDAPAYKAGIRAGDILLMVDDKEVTNMPVDRLTTLLKGQVGSRINLKVQSAITNEVKEFSLMREDVQVKNVPHYTVLDHNTGYIKLDGFTRNASQDVRNAFVELRNQQELNALVLDLRGNGGGLLTEAVNIVNLFVDRGQMVVYTQGRGLKNNRKYATLNAALDTEILLFVLVDGRSASASEIVAGALQDLDRAVVIGETSFGKGLVQNVIPLSYNSQMKVTIAKYYIPSGRCVQAIDYFNESGKREVLPDSLRTAYKTKKGRTVFDGHGIEPDVKVEDNEVGSITHALVRQFMIFDYATEFVKQNDSISSAENFEVNDVIYQQFGSWVKEQGFTYETASEKTLKRFEKAYRKENADSDVQTQQIHQQIENEKADDMQQYREQIAYLLKNEILTRYYYQKGRAIGRLGNDPDMKAVYRLVQNPQEINKILGE